MKIYLATSPWNAFRQGLQSQLTEYGFEVYLGGQPLSESEQKFLKEALDGVDAGVLLLPCGPEPCLEIGYIAGRGKPVFILDVAVYSPEIAHAAWPGVHSGPELVAALEVAEKTKLEI
jgi:nucleoside 2-deoxyribosyltransferase